MEKFYSPYQFIKTEKVSEIQVPFNDIKTGCGEHIRHDYWWKDSCSGRIVCQLKTAGPVMVGGEHVVDSAEKKKPSWVKNYRSPQRNKATDKEKFKNEIAIPANTLRGMISAVVEEISDSSMRVLSDSKYSIRKKNSDGLRAIGQVQKAENGQYSILPLALVSANIEFSSKVIKFDNKWKTIFDKVPLSECLAGYVGDYEKNRYNVAGQSLKQWVSFKPENPEYVYAKENTGIKEKYLTDTIKTPDCQGFLNIFVRKDRNTKKATSYTLTGQKICSDTGGGLISQNEYSDLAADSKEGYQRGILYVLGLEGRDELMPKTKKHELYIPYNKESIKKRDPVPLPDAVIKDFNVLANECYSKSLKEPANSADNASTSNKQAVFPFIPQGHKKTGKSADEDIDFISEGDILYFDVKDDATEVSEISFSAIWRKSITASTYEYFKRSAGGDLNILPWNSGSRTSLTPAEAIFGVVDEVKKLEDENKNENLASRVRFYDALSATGAVSLLCEKKLKILASPKPPSPIMYFHKKNNKDEHGAVGSVMSNKRDILPNGRKKYLHHRQTDIESSIYTSKMDSFDNQKIMCTPINQGEMFFFHIDFNNLSNEELGLLLCAIEPDLNEHRDAANKSFMHKVGLGKPLGLGSVSVQVAAVFFVDRKKRYTASSVTNSRYSRVDVYGGFDESLQKNSRYKLEASTIASLVENDSNYRYPGVNSGVSSTLIKSASFEAMYACGCREVLDQNYPVCYPYTYSDRSSIGNEEKGYLWFDKFKQKQSLSPVTALSGIGLLNTGYSGAGGSSSGVSQQRAEASINENLYLSNTPDFDGQGAREKWEAALRNKLEQYGELKGIKLPKKQDGRHRNFLFAELDTSKNPDAVREAINSGFVFVSGQKITIKGLNKK